VKRIHYSRGTRETRKGSRLKAEDRRFVNPEPRTQNFEPSALSLPTRPIGPRTVAHVYLVWLTQSV